MKILFKAYSTLLIIYYCLKGQRKQVTLDVSIYMYIYY